MTEEGGCAPLSLFSASTGPCVLFFTFRLQ